MNLDQIISPKREDGAKTALELFADYYDFDGEFYIATRKEAKIKYYRLNTKTGMCEPSKELEYFNYKAARAFRRR